jgi:hypothetical protein
LKRQLTDGLSQTEVKSRLRALADTIDTRGWAVKGMSVNMATNPAYFRQSNDRLFDVNALMPASNPDDDVPLENDPLASFSPVAQQFDQMVASSDQAHRAQIAQRMQQIREQQALQASMPAAPTPQPAVTAPIQQVAHSSSHPAPGSLPSTAATIKLAAITTTANSSPSLRQHPHLYSHFLRPHKTLILP